MEDPIKLSDRLFERLTGSHDTPGRPPAPDADADVVGLDPELQAFVRNLRDKDYIDCQLKAMDRFDVDAAWLAVGELVDSEDVIPPYESIRSHRRLHIGGWRRWLSVAAVIAILAGIGVWLHESKMDIRHPQVSPEITAAIEQSEQGGLSGAVIEKKQYPASTAARKLAARPPGHTTADSDDRTVADMLQAIKVTTYHDKEFWLTLPDGSLIHLGRDTRIVYPERFDIDSRDVYLEGEAYFIIARNPACRFVVHTPVATTTVYGTEFNVSARSDTLCSVVLVKGSVGVTSWSGDEQMLSIGEQAVISDAGDISVSEVDLTPYEAWNTGRVDFTGWPLRRVMDVIARWYGMTVIYDSDEYSQIEITGSFNKYDTLGPTLEALSTITDLTIRQQGNTIEISSP